MEKSFLIVSSYDESCGNAYFTIALTAGLSERVDCRVLGLNLKLTQATDRKNVILGDKHIKNICNELEKAQAVNIQFEPQLFGTHPKDAASICKSTLGSSAFSRLPSTQQSIPAYQLDQETEYYSEN